MARLIRRAQVFVLALMVSSAHAVDFHVEDDSLRTVPAGVAVAIAAASQEKFIGYDGKPCRFIGKAVDLQGSGVVRDWIATTADACSWAASAAPVWVLRNTPRGLKAVLFFVTYNLTIGKQSQNGMRHIATARGTAARTEEQLWKYDGKEYRLARMRVLENN